MAGNLVGCARQLVVILRRNFIATGNPPRGSEWRFPIFKRTTPYTGIGFEDEDGSAGEKEIAELGLVEIIAENEPPFPFENHHKNIREAYRSNNHFRALLGDSWVIKQAVRHIPPINEAAVVVRDIAASLASGPFQESRFAYLFSLLLDRVHLFSACGVVESCDFIEQIVVYDCGLTLNRVDDAFVDDLEAAISELGHTSSTVAAPKLKLTTSEQTIIQSIGAKRLTGDEIAKVSGFTNNSALRTKLANLVKRGILNNIPGEGYEVVVVPDNRLTSQ